MFDYTKYMNLPKIYGSKNHGEFMRNKIDNMIYSKRLNTLKETKLLEKFIPNRYLRNIVYDYIS